MPASPAIQFAVVGAGAWGTALALHLGRQQQPTLLITRRAEHADELRRTRENRDYLPGLTLTADLEITADPTAAARADVILLASPSQALRAWAEALRPGLTANIKTRLIISMSKGLEAGTFLRPCEIIAAELPGTEVAALTGPTNAAEVAHGLPAAMVLAADHDSPLLTRVQSALSGPTLRLYTARDLAGAEFGGCLKNIYAIAAGLCDGLRLGDNAKAALLTRALHEMVRVGVALGAQRETFYGLSGFGDLVATCHGAWSRNREFGQRLGEGRTVAELLAGRKSVVEGQRSADAFHQLCQARGIVAPIMAEVRAILHEGRTPADALHALMTRELKAENSHPA